MVIYNNSNILINDDFLKHKQANLLTLKADVSVPSSHHSQGKMNK